MVTFSKPITRDNPQGNCPKELKPDIPFKRDKPQELSKGEYPRTIKKWLTFCQNLAVGIKGQIITNANSMYTITMRLLYRDALIAFKNVEGVNRPQSEHNYIKL
eukprot:6501967-Ditylum_brightwellii.AAC.1